MPNENTQIQELAAQINRLRVDLDTLSGQFYKNNFPSSQTFNKDAIFNTRLRVPVYSAAPSVGEVGDLIAVSGTLYVCTTAGTVASPATFTVVGTQT